MAKDFSYYFAQLRRIEEHREEKAEKEIRKLYKELLTDTKHFIAHEYEQLAENGELTYELLRSKGQDARFLMEVEQRLNDLSPKVSQEIRSVVEEMYELAYQTLYQAVNYLEDDELKEFFKTPAKPTADAVKAVVDNPIAGLTLNDTLEKNRKNIIWDIKREIGIGLTQGDRYETMAKRISKSLDSDYKKAIRIVRTETGRVREKAHLESAKEINQALENGTTDKRLIKTWKSMKDGSVRDQHVKMNGITVGIDEMFILPDGNKTSAPKQSGIAEHDINCRCFAKYDLVSIMAAKAVEPIKTTSEPYFAINGRSFTEEEVREFLEPAMEGLYEEQKVQFMNKVMKGREAERNTFIYNMDKFKYQTTSAPAGKAWYSP